MRAILKNIIGKLRSKIHTVKSSIYLKLNQWIIVKTAKSNKEVFLQPQPPSEKCGGNIEHYYHFIFDLLLPLNAVLKNTDRDVAFILEEFGPLTNPLRYLFPNRIKIESEITVSTKIPRIPLIGMNPKCIYLTPKELEYFRDDIYNSLGVEQSENPNKILLIERLPPDRYYTEEAAIKGSGASRRSIQNHDALKSTLQSMVKEPLVFHNLQLENVTYRKQVEYFSKAKVVFAQHGAALANCIWMKPGSIVVEFGRGNLNHFKIISNLKKHSFFLYHVSDQHATIDVDDFANWILGNLTLRKSLGLE